MDNSNLAWRSKQYANKLVRLCFNNFRIYLSMMPFQRYEVAIGRLIAVGAKMKGFLPNLDPAHKSTLCSALLLIVLCWGHPNFVQSETNASRRTTTGYVVRALFTTAFVNSEPIDQILVGSSIKKVFFFTDLRHMGNQTITHRWEHKGKVISKFNFKVEGPRWRVYSSKVLSADMSGKWTVVVEDTNGWPIKAAVFKYINEDVGAQNMDIILPLEATH